MPLFYVLYKLHKLSEADIKILQRDYTRNVPTRPIGANFCWATQPLALFAAKLLQPYVRRTAEYVKDASTINRILSTLVVPAGALLISADVARLYPAIPLVKCLQLIQHHLTREGCPTYMIEIIIACVRLTLHLNFAKF
eukprot:COSAG05_NODE_932_length_6542_cov_8.110818_2_plen_139_part_00